MSRQELLKLNSHRLALVATSHLFWKVYELSQNLKETLYKLNVYVLNVLLNYYVLFVME